MQETDLVTPRGHVNLGVGEGLEKAVDGNFVP